MNYTAAIDISTFIWCEEDYNSNKNKYYNLLKIAPTVYGLIKKLRIPILLRKEFYQFISSEFPYEEINAIYPDYGTDTLQFLLNADWVSYDETNHIGYTTYPNILKEFFNDDIRNELNQQIIHLHKRSSEHKFITYYHFYNATTNLTVTNNQNVTIDVDTLCYNSKQEIDAFFEKYRIKFEHNPKHRSQLYYDTERKEWISPFSCYHNQGAEAAQKLLEKAILHNDSYYYFDDDNDVYVKFRKTHINLSIYHGFDLSDSNNNVPNEVKKTLNKNGRIF